MCQEKISFAKIYSECFLQHISIASMREFTPHASHSFFSNSSCSSPGKFSSPFQNHLPERKFIRKENQKSNCPEQSNSQSSNLCRAHELLLVRLARDINCSPVKRKALFPLR